MSVRVRPRLQFIIMSDIQLLNKIKSYQENHCYQYQRRLDTLEEDKKILGWDDEFIANIDLGEFEYKAITSKEDKEKATEFIKRYEWLGTVGSYPTHWFAAYYRGIMGGVIIMGMPNAFSKILGDDTKSLERLIARGASASWTPKNLGSNFLMWCIKWMTQNTQYRLFTCYSDPQAKEQGSIYQALNFYYLGQGSGTTVRCINPYNKDKIVTDRAFRARSFYKRYAKDLGIEWQKNWNNDQCMLWENIPDDIEKQLRDYSKKMYAEAEKISFPSKHKYCFILGKNHSETKYLRRKFLERNKVFPYPKERGK